MLTDFFISVLYKDVAPKSCFLLCFWWEIHSHPNLCSSASVYLKIFSLSQFLSDLWCALVDFFYGLMFEIYRDYWICGFKIFTKFRKNLTIISSSIICPPPLGTSDRYIVSCLKISYMVLCLFIAYFICTASISVFKFIGILFCSAWSVINSIQCTFHTRHCFYSSLDVWFKFSLYHPYHSLTCSDFTFLNTWNIVMTNVLILLYANLSSASFVCVSVDFFSPPYGLYIPTSFHAW